jgi:hypothetical protein
MGSAIKVIDISAWTRLLHKARQQQHWIDLSLNGMDEKING